MSEEEENIVARFTSRVRRIMGVIGGLFLLVLIGGLVVAYEFSPLAAVAFVIVFSVVVGMLFPRLT